MENQDFNISRRLEDEINNSGTAEEINNQILPSSDLLDNEVELQNAPPSNPTMKQTVPNDKPSSK